MLSYFLIFCVFTLLVHRIAKERSENGPEFTNDFEADSDLIQAVARYETAEWKMAVVTDKKLNQADWDHTLSILTDNIKNLARV